MKTLAVTPERRAALLRNLYEAIRGYSAYDHRGALVEVRLLEPGQNPSDGPGEYLRALDEVLGDMGEALTICTVRVPSSDFPAPCGRELPCPVHGAPKSAEASMQERIEEFSAGVQHMHNLAHAALTKGGLEEALENIQITAHDLLFGPSDPARDRETQAEQVKP